MKNCIACDNGKFNHKGWCNRLRLNKGYIHVVRELNGVVLSYKPASSGSQYAEQVISELEFRAGHSKEQHGIISL